MATTLEQLKGKLERFIGPIDSEWLINVCNDAQTELLTTIEIPDSATIAINTEDIVYDEPADIKRINRMWLQSERDLGVDRDLPYPYRRYNGSIIFQNRFTKEDTLTVEFYRNLTYFESLDDEIDIADRYSSLYVSYGRAQYYELPEVIQKLGTLNAQRNNEKNYNRYLIIKDQIAAQYSLESQPSTIKECY